MDVSRHDGGVSQRFSNFRSSGLRQSFGLVTERLDGLHEAMIAMIDDAIGRVLGRLAAYGLTNNTVVIFTTDHGDFLGDHQLLLKGPAHYESITHVPFIWAEPDKSAVRRIDMLPGTPTVEEYDDLGVLNTQAHSRGWLGALVFAQKLRQLGKIESRALGVGCLLGRIADNTLLTTVKIGLIPAQPGRSFPRKR
jgi:hypothetical protein